MGETIDTDTAFWQLISQRGIYKQLGMTAGQLQQMRWRFRQHPQSVKYEKKKSILQHAGVVMHTDTTWYAK